MFIERQVLVMNAKDFLSQAYRLNDKINNRVERMAILNSLATNCTSVMTGMPHGPNKETDRMEKTIIRIIELQYKIKEEKNKLVDLKVQIEDAIREIDDEDCQIVLEMRYLMFLRFEEISVRLNYSIENVYRLHRKGLKIIKIPESVQ